MHGLHFLQDLVVLFTLAIIVVVGCHRIGIPPVVGFLLTGVIAGPSVLGLIEDKDSVEILAEVGVVLLLFAIGIEFSMERLLRIRSTLLIGGTFQVFLTGGACAAGAGLFLALPVRPAVFFGMLMALSSTAVVLKIYSDRGEVDSPQGRITLGILIFQDLAVVPMVILTPFLAGEGGETLAILWTFTKAFLMVAGALGFGRYVVPWVLGRIVRTRSREAFLLAVVILCIGTAWVGSLAGLSLALGAFIAGLIVSQSEYSHQALSEIIPFRDVFSSLFLISIGMLLDVGIFRSPVIVVLGVLGTVCLKVVVAGGAALVLGYSFRVAVIVGLSLAQVGEFSFVLLRSGLDAELLDERLYQLFLAGAVITMTLTPILTAVAPSIADRLSRFVPRRLLLPRRIGLAPEAVKELEGHVIIVGYGLNGRNLAQALRRVSIPYVVVEMNPETVAAERRKGERILYGDASSSEILERAGIHRARVLVIAISDPSSARRATSLARRLHPGLHTIVRTRYLGEMEALLDLGASEVVPEEFETSLEIFARTMRTLMVPWDIVDQITREARMDGYGVMRSIDPEPRVRDEVGSLMAGAVIEVLRVEPGSAVAGKTLMDSGLRQASGATVLGLKTGEEFSCNPPTTATLAPGAVAIVYGTPEQVASAAKLFRGADTDTDNGPR